MKDVLRLEWQLFLLAVQFLTRLPVPCDLPYSDDLQVRSVRYYPMVGLVVGGIGAAVLWLAGQVFPGGVAVLLAMAATLVVTGALHEDGLADAMDGLVGGADKAQALDIMRDSRIGSFGAVALGLALALKAALLMALAPAMAALALVAGHGLGRLAVVHVIATTAYARSVGSKFKAPAVTPDGYRIALATGIGLLILLVLGAGTGAALCGMLGCIALAQLFRRYFRARIDGYTGDCLGATVVLAELGLYLGVVAWL